MTQIEKDLLEPSLREIENLMSEAHVTNPNHGGKVTCHKCNGFIQEKDAFLFLSEEYFFGKVYFHKDCFNRYEHYYGLDRPLD